MPKELVLQVSPEIAADALLLQQYLSKQIKVGVHEIRHVSILKRSIDARQKAIKINLKVLIYLQGEAFQESSIALPDYKNVAHAQEVIVVGAGPAGLFAALQLIELGLKPIARLVNCASAGVHPRIMGIGPVEAGNKALKRAGLTFKDIDLIELNEAFASQSIAVINELGLNKDIVNINGGAIALGHPLGCSGARIVVTLSHILQQNKKQYGAAAICNGGGGASAIIIERL